MKTTKKALVLALCAVLLVVSTVFVTMAYLTSTDSVKNTFTVGDVAITLDEAEVETDGTVIADAERVKANKYHLIPAHYYVKDPTIHVADGSEDCWVFVKLENGLKDIIASETIEEQMTTNGWTCIDTTNNIWAHADIANAGDDVVVFENFTLEGDADVANYADAEINVTGYAVQADGFTTADAAWTAAFANN